MAKPFGANLTETHYSRKHKTYLRIFGQPFAWLKPRAVLKTLCPGPGDRILDIGCRSGLYAAEFAARGASVTALDINPKILGTEIPRTREFAMQIQCLVGNALRLPFAAQSFTKVTILDCLEHIEDDAGVIAECHRVLKPGGRLLITVPTIPGYPPHRVLTRLMPLVPERWLRRARADEVGSTLEHVSEPPSQRNTTQQDPVILARAGYEEILRAFGHVRHYDETLLRALLEKSGFRILTMNRYQMLFESEMICFHFSVKGFQSVWLYPVMLAVAQLDALLPRSYPGVGLLAWAERK